MVNAPAVPTENRHIEIPLTADAPGMLAHFIDAFCADTQLPGGIAAKLQIIAEELTTNMLKYGAPPPNSAVDVSLILDADMLSLCLKDSCTAFNPFTDRRADASNSQESNDEIGGWGLDLVASFCDRHCYERCDNRNILTMCLNLNANSSD